MALILFSFIKAGLKSSRIYLFLIREILFIRFIREPLISFTQ